MASHEQNKRAETLSMITRIINTLLSDELKKIENEELIASLKECEVFRKSKIVHIFEFKEYKYIRVGSNFYEKVHLSSTFISEKIEQLELNYKKNDFDLATALTVLSTVYK